MKLTLEQFNGPLDLLLSLIQDKKMAISEIAIGSVTEQYLEYLDQLEEHKRTSELADFLVIATRLLLLKSRALLPQFLPEEEESSSLEEQLRRYKRFQDASKELNKLWLSPFYGSFRVEPARKAKGFVWPENVSQDNLQKAMKKLLKRLKPLKPLPKTHIDKAVSMKQKIDHIRKVLKTQKQVSFHDVLSNTNNRTEVIVGFIALLELVKQQHIALRQEDAFSDIMIQKV